MNLLDDITKQFQAAAQARRDALRQSEEDRGVDRVAAQAEFEARRAREDAERERRRGPTIPREELGRRQAKRVGTIAALRNLQAMIETEQRNLNAALVKAVEESDDLEAAIAVASRKLALAPVANVIVTRLAALNAEVW